MTACRTIPGCLKCGFLLILKSVRNIMLLNIKYYYKDFFHLPSYSIKFYKKKVVLCNTVMPCVCMRLCMRARLSACVRASVRVCVPHLNLEVFAVVRSTILSKQRCQLFCVSPTCYHPHQPHFLCPRIK